MLQNLVAVIERAKAPSVSELIMAQIKTTATFLPALTFSPLKTRLHVLAYID